MKKIKNNLILLKDDYDLLNMYIRSGMHISRRDMKNAEELKEELKKAVVMEKEHFPADVVRLNSKVKIEDKSTGRLFEFTLVLPEKANLGLGRISILAPLGTALIGYRESQEIEWVVPAGKKNFNILEVNNAYS